MDKSWEFSMYGEKFRASVIDINESEAEINANADSEHSWYILLIKMHDGLII